jgi:hypothetical protein
MLFGVLAASFKQYCIGGQVFPNQNSLEALRLRCVACIRKPETKLTACNALALAELRSVGYGLAWHVDGTADLQQVEQANMSCVHSCRTTR